MKSLFKFTQLLLITFVALSFASCKKEKEEIKGCYLVDYIPTACAGPSTTLGLKSPIGKYFHVLNNNSEFSKFNLGDKVNIKYKETSSCIHCFACHCLAPDKCITLEFIDYCKKGFCSPIVLSRFWDSSTLDTSSNYQITNSRLEGDNLEITLSLTGCDIDINPDLFLIQNPEKVFPRRYDAYLVYNRTPQLCMTELTKTFCFDISKIKEWDSQADISLKNRLSQELRIYSYK